MAKVKVSQLKAGDKIRTSSQGVFTIVGLIRVFQLENRREMYNFETDSSSRRFCARGGAKVEVLNK
jgi:hypothetical protein